MGATADGHTTAGLLKRLGTIWIVRHGETAPRLITVIPEMKR